MHKIFFVRMNEMEENGGRRGKKRKWRVKFIAIVIPLFRGTMFTNFTRKNLFLYVHKKILFYGVKKTCRKYV